MRVFVTGATGLIGFAIVQELIASGHQVTGLARSEASGKRLVAAGAKVHLGTVEDLDSLRRGATDVEGAIHTAFYHKISHMPFASRIRVLAGGAPGGIFTRFMGAAVAADRLAIETIAASLPKSSPLVATFGTMGLEPGVLATEDQPYYPDPKALGFTRATTEDTMKKWAEQGLRTSVIRLPPIVHGPNAFGLASLLIPIARKKRESGYVAEGMNRWPSVNHLDAARLFRLALEHGPSGGTYHGVDEEGTTLKEIAGVIGLHLGVPVVSKPLDQVKGHFGFTAPFVGIDNPASSKLTRERLGWSPTHEGFLAALNRSDVFADS